MTPFLRNSDSGISAMSKGNRKPLNTPYNEPPAICELMDEFLSRKRFSFRMSRMLLPQKWVQIAGEAIARNARPVKIEKKKLYLSVSNAAWMNELTYLKDELIEKINSMAHGELIEDISMRVGRNKLPQSEQPPIDKPAAVAEELPLPVEEELRKAEEISSRVKDSLLRQTIREVYLRSLLRRRKIKS